MLFLFFLSILLGLYLLVPKSTALHEILRLPGYNFKAQTAPRDNMQMERYSFGAHRKQYLYFFGPKTGKASRRQVIMYYHGGGWTFGTPMMFRCHAQLLVDQGYYVIMPSYRRLPFYRCPDMREDARLALQKTMAILEEKQLGHLQLILSGLSAGGHLAALTAYDEQAWLTTGVSRERLAGLLFLAAPLDLRQMASSLLVWRLAGWRNSDLFRASNPITYLKEADTLPTFILHGTMDGLVDYKSALSFMDKRGAQGLTFYSIEKGSHLDAGNWIFEQGLIREQIFAWLDALD